MTTRKDPFEINLLLDAYETLLTPKQQEVMRLHYREDFSLSEISEALSISRAGALDHIRRASDSLYDYEQRLHCSRETLSCARCCLRCASIVTDRDRRSSISWKI